MADASNSNTIIERHLQLDQEQLDQPVAVLAEFSELSHQQIKQAMKKGCVWITRGKQTQRLRRASRTLHVGDELHLYYNSNVLEQTPPTAELISDEQDYSVWLKPSGMFSQGSKWGDHCTITRWAETHLQPERNAFAVHRLDRATTGLILIAHKKSIARDLAKLFETRQVEKTYHAIVEGLIEDDQITLEAEVNGKAATSHISVLNRLTDHNRSLLRIHIETGRKHQIRQHLAGYGHPIVGDRLYGSNRLADPSGESIDLQLFATDLAFRCPVTDAEQHYRVSAALLSSIDRDKWPTHDSDQTILSKKA